MPCTYNARGWDGTEPRRRFAVFGDVIHGEQIVLVRGDDIERAPHWGNFIRWFGKEKPPLYRNVHWHCDSTCGCKPGCKKRGTCE